MMMGCAGSGKSTWLANRAPKDAIIVSRDAIRFSMITDTDEYFAKEPLVYKEFVRQIQEGLKTGRDVYIDSTNLHINGRKKLLDDIGRTNYDSVIIIWIDTDLPQILNQNALRTGRSRVPENVITDMYNHMQYPSFKEGFEEIIRYTPGFKTVVRRKDNDLCN